MVGKLRNEDYSVYFFVKDALTSKVDRILDSYPYTELEDETLQLPCVSVEHLQTNETGGELGNTWFRRTWAIDVFAVNDSQRDEISDVVFQALDGTIPIKNYSSGFRADGKSILGADLTIIERGVPEDRMMRPVYSFDTFTKLKFWRVTIIFSMTTTQTNS